MSALGDFFKEVADAIRTKTGKTNGIAPINFPQEILSIETGGGTPEIMYVDISVPSGVGLMTTLGNDGYPVCLYLQGNISLSKTYCVKGGFITLFPISSSNTLSLSVTGDAVDVTSNLGFLKGKCVGVKVNGPCAITVTLS